MAGAGQISVKGIACPVATYRVGLKANWAAANHATLTEF